MRHPSHHSVEAGNALWDNTIFRCDKTKKATKIMSDYFDFDYCPFCGVQIND